ncbi:MULTISPECIES: hypothetical protein [unclassified Aureimonas]|uniref:hypothetical protein n=1 Tax=unclassified Aureimonas TaxID=2615206 RepID=UPI0006F5E7F5|nr:MULTISPECIES: hypothetical protein [unclassified Aureimonas]KQT60357.1 hypothetical protein ASG62_06780 [Aureimonas sp. Leaf427]KQT79234.1 hypothetical protein ASG54_09375 [Aureimonas sp. Leaf460]
MERLSGSGGALPYEDLAYREIVASEELRKLRLVDLKPSGRSKLAIIVTEKGQTLIADGYRTDQIVVRVTAPQIDLLRHLNNAPSEDSVGQPINELQGVTLDVCRRMSLRGWVEWYDGYYGSRWARLTAAGREVLEAIDALDEAIAEMNEARRLGPLH